MFSDEHKGEDVELGASKNDSPGGYDTRRVKVKDSSLGEGDPASPKDSLLAPTDCFLDPELHSLCPKQRQAFKIQQQRAELRGPDRVAKRKPSKRANCSV